MKKIIATSAALLMAGSCFVANNAFAEDETGVTISGDSRVRLRYLDNVYFGNFNNGYNYDKWDSRVRLKFKGQAAGGAYVTARIRLVDTDFNGGPDASNDYNVWSDYGYLGIPFSDNFKIEAGKYRVNYGNLFLLEDIGMSGIRGFYTTDTLEIIPFWEIMKEGHDGNAYDYMEDNDTERFGTALTVKMDNWSAGFIAGYQSDDTTSEELYILADGSIWGLYTDNENEGFFGSVYANADLGMFALDTEIAYVEEGLTDWNKTEDDSWGGYVKGTYKMDALSIALDIAMTQDGFMPDAIYGYQMMGVDEPTTVVNVGEGGDWLIMGVRTNYAVSEALALTGNLAYATVDAEADNADVDFFEISGVMAYNISKGATFSWYAGYLMPDFDDSTLEDDGAFATYGKFEVSF
ncbi:porin [Desulfogranum japonicum]|uniref:porin n=1 Tax=Desulfogranum japonicum TaxID=231447 RepID=UPI000415E0FA|nr:porin [Desulfogranum japonicum]